MRTLRTLKKLLLGETWLLPVGIAVVLIAGGLLIRPLAPRAWPHIGGFILLAGVLVVLLMSTARSARSRSRASGSRETRTRPPRE